MFVCGFQHLAVTELIRYARMLKGASGGVYQRSVNMFGERVGLRIVCWCKGLVYLVGG